MYLTICLWQDQLLTQSLNQLKSLGEEQTQQFELDVETEKLEEFRGNTNHPGGAWLN